MTKGVQKALLLVPFVRSQLLYLLDSLPEIMWHRILREFLKILLGTGVPLDLGTVMISCHVWPRMMSVPLASLLRLRHHFTAYHLTLEI